MIMKVYQKYYLNLGLGRIPHELAPRLDLFWLHLFVQILWPTHILGMILILFISAS